MTERINKVKEAHEIQMDIATNCTASEAEKAEAKKDADDIMKRAMHPASTDKVYCPAFSKEDTLTELMEITPSGASSNFKTPTCVALPDALQNATHKFSNYPCVRIKNAFDPVKGTLDENYPIHGSRGFKYCWIQMVENSKAHGGGIFQVDKTKYSDKTPIFKDDGDKFEMLGTSMDADFLKYGKDFVNLIKSVRKALGEDKELVGDLENKEDGDIFPIGVPFLFWEQYVELMHHLLEKSAFAAIVCLVTVTVLLVSMLSETADIGLPMLIVSCMHGAFLVVCMCLLTMIQIYGFMGIMSIKLNAIPQVTLIMAIGMTVEFTAHLLLAFLNAPNPASSPSYSFASRRARAMQALARMAVPTIHGSITTFLGIVMLADADTEFIVLYYFMLYFLLVVFGAVNGLLVLPAWLALIGPIPTCSDDGARKVAASGTVVPASEKVVANGAIEKELGGESVPELET